MDSDRLNRWLTLLANFGVVVGLILLVIELQQNQAMMELEHTLVLIDADKTESEYLATLRQPRIDNPELMELWRDGFAGKPLSEIDQMRWDGMCNSNSWAVANMYRRSMALGRPDTARGAVESQARSILNSPGAKVCWENMRFELWGYEEWRQAVDEAVAEKIRAKS